MKKSLIIISVLGLLSCGLWIAGNNNSCATNIITGNNVLTINTPDLDSSSSDSFYVNPLLPQVLVPHGPITVQDEGDFVGYGFPGAGTEGNPFIIENYEILPDPVDIQNYGIRIVNTNSYFIIRNNHVKGAVGGIFIDSADNCIEISNNLCDDSSQYGLHISSSFTDCTIKNNGFYNQGRGIYVTYSSYYEIINNTCNNNDEGIFTGSHSSVDVLNNTCNFKIMYF